MFHTSTNRAVLLCNVHLRKNAEIIQVANNFFSINKCTIHMDYLGIPEQLERNLVNTGIGRWSMAASNAKFLAMSLGRSNDV